jgi:putative phosphoribosyl transferase
MHAAIKILRKHQPKKIIVAIPVAPKSALQQLKPEADEIVCLLTPKHFNAVSYWYRNFPQVSDQEVCDLLNSEVETFQETVIY